MPAIVSPCDQPACTGHVEFDVPGLDEWHGRLFGMCDECHASYTLYGGERRRVSAPVYELDPALWTAHRSAPV